MDDRTSPQGAREVAERVRDYMLVSDAVPRALGIEIGEVAEGFARARMVVRADMLNGFAILHGGMLATLADTAFAYACNSRNEMTVASGISLEFVAPGREGDVLVAEAREQAQAGRLGIYDVVVRKQTGETLALMRGKSYGLKGRAVVPEGV